MATDFKSIPIIDIGPLLEKCNDPKMAEDRGVSEVIKMLDQACRETGFFYVEGHGIPDSLIKEVRDVARKFFHLPYEEKLKIKMSPLTGYRGYQRIGENVTEGKPDIHEAIDCYREVKPGTYGALGSALEGSNMWPNNPPNSKQLMEEYVTILTDLSRNIMRGIALALGGSPDTFGGERAGDPFWVLRIIGYPGSTDTRMPDMQDDGVGCGAHTDYGLLTLVNQDDDIAALQCHFLSPLLFQDLMAGQKISGGHESGGDDALLAFQYMSRVNLQKDWVRNRSGEWIWAVPIPGTFVCNIGDMLKVLSNGLYESTLHRVVTSSKYRVSIPFFYEPNFDKVLEPLDFCKQKTGGVSKFEPVVYGEHLVRKVTTNFAM